MKPIPDQSRPRLSTTAISTVDLQGTEVNWATAGQSRGGRCVHRQREMQRKVKVQVAKTKQRAYDDLYARMDSKEGNSGLYRLARQRDRDGRMCNRLG